MLWWLKLFTHAMPFTYEEKCFVKISLTICMAPKIPGYGLTTLHGGYETEHVSHSDFQPGRSQRQSVHVLAWRIFTKRSLTNLLITGVTNWRLWFDWMVDTLNSCFDYLDHLLQSSVMLHICSKIIRAFCHCVLSVTMILWQKVNITNNDLTFQNKMDVILCDKN